MLENCMYTISAGRLAASCLYFLKKYNYDYLCSCIVCNNFLYVRRIILSLLCVVRDAN